MIGGHDQFLDLCAAWAVGSIEPQDQRVLEEHLERGCAECQAFLRDASGSLTALALTSPPARPGRGLKARVMTAVLRPGSQAVVEGEEPVRPPRRRGVLPEWAWTIAALLLVALGIGWWRAHALSGRVAELEEQVASLGGLEDEIARFRREAPQAREIVLAAQAGSDPARKARVLYDATTRRALVVFENFVAPAGSAFELWTLRDKKPFSEGLVRVGPDGRGTQRIENVGDPALLSGFAVSPEAAGGSKDRQTPASVAYYGGV